MANGRPDTRRFRRINSLGPNPNEQAKLIGSRTSYEGGLDFSKPRAVLLKKAFVDDARNLDMTLIPRRAERMIRLYLRGRTVIAPMIIN